MLSQSPRLELKWPGKDQFLLLPRDEGGKPVWVDQDHPAASEVRLTDFIGTVGVVNECDWHSDNLLFTGDSLDVLRNLSESPEYRSVYRGKVRLVYIDPPFNTGQTFEHYDDWMEHSTWLSFMHDRLRIIRDLLTADGTVWIHLDDAEHHRMRCLLDEVMGAENYIETIVWSRSDVPRSVAKFISNDQDYVLVYAKDKSKVRFNRLPRDSKTDSAYKNPDNDPRGPWRPTTFTATKVYTKGLYTIVGPTGKKFLPPNGTYWRSDAETFKNLNAEGRVWWGAKGTAAPMTKTYLSEVGDLIPRSLWHYQDVGSSRIAKYESKKLFGSTSSFGTPKPEKFMERIIRIASNPGDIILDCFAGSGTTAAVAHKMERRWVTAEISSETVSAFTLPRMKKVVTGADAGGISQAVEWAGGGGFRMVEVGPSMYEQTLFGIMLADWATNGRFSRAVAGQLGFEWQPNAAPFSGRLGRMRLAVFDGAVGVEEVRHLVAALEEKELVTVVAKSVLPGAETCLSALSKGSQIRKAPRDLLTAGAARARRQTEGISA